MLRENIRVTIEEHLNNHGNFRCPQCGGIILDNWIEGHRHICPVCFGDVGTGQLRLRREADKPTEQCIEELVNNIATYLSREKLI